MHAADVLGFNVGAEERRAPIPCEEIQASRGYTLVCMASLDPGEAPCRRDGRVGLSS